MVQIKGTENPGITLSLRPAKKVGKNKGNQLQRGEGEENASQQIITGADAEKWYKRKKKNPAPDGTRRKKEQKLSRNQEAHKSKSKKRSLCGTGAKIRCLGVNGKVRKKSVPKNGRSASK